MNEKYKEMQKEKNKKEESSEEEEEEEQRPIVRGRNVARGYAGRRARSGADILRMKPQKVARSMSRPRVTASRG